MIEYFNPNQELILPELAGHLGIDSDKFTVVQRFDGGMGTCYRIVDAKGTSYALKVIHSDLLLDEKSVYRYNEELKLWLTFSACDSIAEAKCMRRPSAVLSTRSERSRSRSFELLMVCVFATLMPALAAS